MFFGFLFLGVYLSKSTDGAVQKVFIYVYICACVQGCSLDLILFAVDEGERGGKKKIAGTHQVGKKCLENIY